MHAKLFATLKTIKYDHVVDMLKLDPETEVEIHIPHHHHHHGSTKIRRNPLKNLDLDFKFDVNSF